MTSAEVQSLRKGQKVFASARGRDPKDPTKPQVLLDPWWEGEVQYAWDTVVIVNFVADPPCCDSVLPEFLHLQPQTAASLDTVPAQD